MPSKAWRYDATVAAFLEELPAIQARLTAANITAPAERLLDLAKVLHLAQHGALPDVKIPAWLVPAKQQTLREAFLQLTTGTGSRHARAATAWRDAHRRARRHLRVQSLTHPLEGPPLTKEAAYRVVELEEAQVFGEPPSRKQTGVKADCVRLAKIPGGPERFLDTRADLVALRWLVVAPPPPTPDSDQHAQAQQQDAGHAAVAADIRRRARTRR